MSESNMCLGQTWYLGNDMQFFIISPPIIFIMWKSPKVGKIVSGVLVLLSTVSAITVAWVNEFPASPLFQGMDFDYMRWYYFVPWCRFQPYICGMCLGFFLHHMRGKKLGINPVAAAWIWVNSVLMDANFQNKISRLLPLLLGPL